MVVKENVDRKKKKNRKKCKSKELITAFNKQSMYISSKSLKSQWSNLAKYTVLQSLLVAIPLPSHFDTQSSTVVALDNFDNAEETAYQEESMLTMLL